MCIKLLLVFHPRISFRVFEKVSPNSYMHCVTKKKTGCPMENISIYEKFGAVHRDRGISNYLYYLFQNSETVTPTTSPQQYFFNVQ